MQRIQIGQQRLFRVHEVGTGYAEPALHHDSVYFPSEEDRCACLCGSSPQLSNMGSFSRLLLIAVFAMYLAASSEFEMEQCQACLEEDVCEYCIKAADDGSKVGVCDCNDEDVDLYGDCEDSHWNAKVTKASACNLLAYPRTAPILIFLLTLLSIIIVTTGCVVVSKFMYRNLCCCFRVVKEDRRKEMVNLNAMKDHEVL